MLVTTMDFAHPVHVGHDVRGGREIPAKGA